MLYYCHDVKKVKTVQKFQGKWDSYGMSAFSSFEKYQIVILHARQTAVTYCTVLEDYLHPLMGTHNQNKYSVQFEQDNDSKFTAKLSKNWLRFYIERFLGLACMLP